MIALCTVTNLLLTIHRNKTEGSDQKFNSLYIPELRRAKNHVLSIKRILTVLCFVCKRAAENCNSAVFLCAAGLRSILTVLCFVCSRVATNFNSAVFCVQ